MKPKTASQLYREYLRLRVLADQDLIDLAAGRPKPVVMSKKEILVTAVATVLVAVVIGLGWRASVGR